MMGQSQAKKKESNVSRQHQVLWNLFAHNLDSVIMSLIESDHFKIWSTPLVQLIALVYKDQHVTTLERLLHVWLESSLSESSEDNESNTSPQHQCQDGNGCCSSSQLTPTEPNSTEDSSDGNSGERHSDKGPTKIEENDADYEESTNNDDIDRLSVTSISVTVASLAALSDIADPLEQQGDLQSLACPIGTPLKREAG